MTRQELLNYEKQITEICSQLEAEWGKLNDIDNKPLMRDLNTAIQYLESATAVLCQAQNHITELN